MSAPVLPLSPPLHELIRSHVLAAERLHGDDTTVPVLAKGKTITGRLWAYVRDDRPFGQGQTGPPAALFHYSRDRRGEHPERHLAGYAGILQADAYGGFGGSTRRHAPAGPSPRPSAGPMPGGSSSSSPTSPEARQGADRTARRRGGSARSMRSSPTNATINGLDGRRPARPPPRARSSTGCRVSKSG